MQNARALPARTAAALAAIRREETSDTEALLTKDTPETEAIVSVEMPQTEAIAAAAALSKPFKSGATLQSGFENPAYEEGNLDPKFSGLVFGNTDILFRCGGYCRQPRNRDAEDG